MKYNIKYMVIGFLIGLFASACDSNLMADNESYDYLGEQGTTEWNPIYVKIVE